MHQTFADVAASGPLTAEVCIIGAGAAGQTLAKALADAGRQVLLVESGGFDYDPGVQALNQAENTGLPYYDLERARLRFFGGTTAIWGGRTCRLDPIDFEVRGPRFEHVVVCAHTGPVHGRQTVQRLAVAHHALTE